MAFGWLSIELPRAHGFLLSVYAAKGATGEMSPEAAGWNEGHQTALA